MEILMAAFQKNNAAMDSVMMGMLALWTPARAIYVSTHPYRDVVSLILIAMMGRIAPKTVAKMDIASTPLIC
jgi:hypothetical protein